MGFVLEATLFLIAAVIAVPLFRWLGLGSVLGYLGAGIVIGPAVLGLVGDVEHILHFSEIGVVMLLFIIGLELHPSRLWAMRKSIFGLGGGQIALTTFFLGGAGYLLGLGAMEALVIGLILSLSSTAFVLQILAERGELAKAHGRAGFSVLLMQDLAVIPLLALTPLMISGGQTSIEWLSIGLAILTVVAVIVGGHYLLSPFLRIIVRTRSSDLFTAAALLVVLGIAALMETAGLSMALGAFLAGVLLADSEYRHALESTIEPFKGLLLGLFFIAVGMGVDLNLLAAEPLAVLGLVAGLVILKALALGILAVLFGIKRQSAFAFAVYLAQGGEFAFVLFAVLQGSGGLAGETISLLTLVVTLSMVATPLLVMAFSSLGLMSERAVKPDADEEPMVPEGRVIIAGFGRFGQIVARLLRMKNVPFTALENDPDQLATVRRFGGDVHYGNAANLDLLRAAGVDKAEIFVIASDEPDQAVATAELLRTHFPKVKIYARARNRQVAHRLLALGVHFVERETYESSLKTAAAVYRGLGFSSTLADRAVAAFRRHDEALMDRQLAFYDDETKLIASAQEAAKELETLLEEDQAALEERQSSSKPAVS
ncbi:MAG: monovalent cation:proton antiporter-2 (CPA2) family protein [Alphaproteobacteria bacterium]|nr:monovalent cation:proton antiporter-2 (CPA2) family protein [Alphaproteobacteria bacterium]